MSRRVILAFVVLVATLGLAATALAHPPDDTSFGPGHSDEAGAAEVAKDKCSATWDLTPLAGETGSDKDEKVFGDTSSGGDTGVSNCDQWWNWVGKGSNGP